ncbi:MAG TPA: hypothetical protein VJU61_10295, partial [Polyangiaceae bacterium]|nr:hypothetical protein [Polyangiaceae bacterium]
MALVQRQQSSAKDAALACLGVLQRALCGARALPVVLAACQSAPTEPVATQAQSLLLDPDFEASSASGAAEPARDYTLFEADPVRPVAVLRESGLVAVTNTVDDYLELLRPKGRRGLERCGAVQVGLRPVAVAVVEESAELASVWVVNHLSDSISVVRLRPGVCAGDVVQTLYVGDEPRDIVVAATEAGERRVFVTSAHRGQHHPLGSARQATDQATPPLSKTQPGLADVFVFDPAAPSAPRVVNLFSDVPRGLAVGDGVVYAAGFRSGNRTSSVVAELVAARGQRSLLPLLARDEQGQFVERDGELLLAPGVAGVARMAGGNAAVAGSGRCVSDPRWQGFEPLLQLCVATDAQQHVERVVVQSEGVVDASCQCTSGDGTLQPPTAVIVKFFDNPGDCGQDFTSFPDGSAGCWLDAAPGGTATPAAAGGRQSPPLAWNEEVRFSLPDRDVFAIDVNQLTVERAFSGVGTTLFNLAVQPRTGKVFVTNTDANNLTRFEGFGQRSSTSVIGHLVESRVTVIDPGADRVVPVHLNDHIDYSRCCERLPGENEKSLAFPTGIDFSTRGDEVYFTALGSDKLVIADARDLEHFHNDDAARRAGKLAELTLGPSVLEPAGPVGLALDAQRGLLYVKTLFSNELVVVDPSARTITSRVALPSPEPESITKGRHVLYNARLTSSHGDSACA